jgi:hypothetical protein
MLSLPTGNWRRNAFHLPYSISDNYTAHTVGEYASRSIPVVITIRTHAKVEPARTRVTQWVRDAAAAWPELAGSVTSDNRGHRRGFNTEVRSRSSVALGA